MSATTHNRSHRITDRQSAYLAGFTAAREETAKPSSKRTKNATPARVFEQNPYPPVRGNLFHHKPGTMSLRNEWRKGAEFGLSL